MMNWLKNAFAVEATKTVVPSATQATTIDRVCREVVRRRMTLPAQMLLESSIPVHFLAGQLLRFFEPFVTLLLDPRETREFAAFLEQAGSVEYICRRLEEMERAESQRSRSAPAGDSPTEEMTNSAET